MPNSTRQRAHPQGTNARNRMIRRPAWGPPICAEFDAALGFDQILVEEDGVG